MEAKGSPSSKEYIVAKTSLTDALSATPESVIERKSSTDKGTTKVKAF